MDNYFKHFPLVQYGNSVANTVAVNLFAKIAFQKNLQLNYEVFHPYTIKEGDRPDTIAYLYYGDSGYDWLVYFSNNIVDPYYDWYMDTETFKRFIASKYGSLTEAKRKIKYFRSNYVEDDSMIEPSAYESLTTNQKRFWKPLTRSSGQIFKYERKKEDIIYNTNKVQELLMTYTGNSAFTTGEYVYQQSGGMTISSAIMGVSNTTHSTVSNITGTITPGVSLVGGTSGATATVAAVNTLTTSIPVDIQQYFTAVSYFDHEDELNEDKKNIRLIDVAYIQSLEAEFKRLLAS